VKDQPPGAEPLPNATVEERDEKDFAIGRARFFQQKGVVRRDMLDLAIADGFAHRAGRRHRPRRFGIVFPI